MKMQTEDAIYELIPNDTNYQKCYVWAGDEKMARVAATTKLNPACITYNPQFMNYRTPVPKMDLFYLSSINCKCRKITANEIEIILHISNWMEVIVNGIKIRLIKDNAMMQN